MSALWTAFETAPAARTVFLHRGAPIAWADVRASVEAIADVVADTGGPVFLHTRSAAAFLAGLLAAMRLWRPVVCPGFAGRAYLDEIRGGGGVFLTDAGKRDGVSLVADVGGAGSRSGVRAREPVGGDALPITFMTSGTTAQPKAVAKTLRQLEHEVSVLENLWGGADGPVMATVSHQHIYGLLFRIMWPVIAGRPSDALQTEFWERLEGRLGAGSVLVSSPAHLSRLPGEAASLLGRPRIIFSSGGPLSFADAKACETRFGQVPVEVFGSTETGGISWRRQHQENAAWTPFPKVEIGADAAGLLSVRSPLTGRREPVVTGDRVTIEPSGTFRFLGRADTVVKIEGKRVSLARVERALRDLAEVQDAGVAVVDVDGRARTLAAVVVLDADGNRDLGRLGPFAFSRDLRRRLAERLDPVERPKAWRFVDRVPTNSDGKRTQAGLRALFEAASVRAEGPFNAEVDLELDGRSVWFDGHFPGQPIFPGVAEIHLAVFWGWRLWRWRPATAHLTRLKFSRVLRPGDRVRLVLVRDLEKDTLRFRYFTADEVAGEGVVGGNR